MVGELFLSSSASGSEGGGEGGEEKEVSSAKMSSRDWMVDSPRWRGGSSSESEFEAKCGLGAEEAREALAALRTDSRADLGRGRLVLRRAGKLSDLGLSFLMRSDVASLRTSLPSRMKSLSSSTLGVGMGGPRPPAGRGVSTQAPVTRGVWRYSLSMVERGVSSDMLLSVQDPMIRGVVSLVVDLWDRGVSSSTFLDIVLDALWGLSE